MRENDMVLLTNSSEKGSPFGTIENLQTRKTADSL